MVPSLVKMLLRSMAVLVATVCVGAALFDLVQEPLISAQDRIVVGGFRSLAEMPFDEALTAVCAAAITASGVWLVTTTILVVAQALLETLAVERRDAGGWPTRLATVVRRMTDRVCPLLARRVILAGCGLALTTGLTMPPAVAERPGEAARAAVASQRSLAGLALPDRTVDMAVSVTVVEGDSLWRIADRLLPDDASDAEISHAWQAIYAANSGRIGPDPDLLLPGVTLQVPSQMHL